jgi:ribosomal protein L7Ae-like RNA K-turn-binding protein
MRHDVKVCCTMENDSEPGKFDIQDLAGRVKLGIRRKQVVLGRDKLFNLGKRGQVGMVWAMKDLSRRARGKLQLECTEFEIPLLHEGEMAEIGELTGASNTKVYVIKKGFSGLHTVLRHLARGDL